MSRISTFVLLPSTRRRRASALVVLGFATLEALRAAQAPTANPFLGKWLGTIGSPRERVEAGIDITAGPDGEMAIALTQPGAGYYAMASPGPVVRDGNRISVASMGLALELHQDPAGDRLEGVFPGPNSAASLARVDALPTRQPIPSFPRGPEPRWQARLAGQVYAGPVVRDGVAYVGTTGGVLDAIKVADGEEVWAFAAGAPIYGCALATPDAVYVVADNGFLFKVDRANDQELWRYDLGDARVPRVLPHPMVYAWDWRGVTPVIADGVVFVGAGDGGFHAVDAATGARKWRFATGGKIREGAAIDGPRVVVGSADKVVYALDRASGVVVWKHETEAEIDTAPTPFDGRILIGNRGGGLYALNAATGERLWRLSFWGSWIESTPVVVDGTIYIGSSDLGRVSAIAPTDGKVLWRTDVYGWAFGTPVVTADRIYAGAAGGTPYFMPHVASLVALDRPSGTVVWRWPIPESPDSHQWGIVGSPVLAGDTLLVTTVGGSLYGFPLS